MDPRIVKIKQIREKVINEIKGDPLKHEAPRGSNGDALAQPRTDSYHGEHVSTGTGNGAEKSPGEYQNVY